MLARYMLSLCAVVELFESFQGCLMASAERKPIMEVWAEPELRGPGPRNSSTDYVSARLSIYLSPVGVRPKRLNVGSREQHITMRMTLLSWCQKFRRNSNRITPNKGAKLVKIGGFRPISL